MRTSEEQSTIMLPYLFKNSLEWKIIIVWMKFFKMKFYESSSRDVQKRLSRYKTQSQAPLFLQTRRRKQQNITPTYLDINQNWKESSLVVRIPYKVAENSPPLTKYYSKTTSRGGDLRSIMFVSYLIYHYEKKKEKRIDKYLFQIFFFLEDYLTSIIQI